MGDSDWPTAGFEEHRDHLRAVAYRLLGSMTDADDAVQDTWLRLSGTDISEVENLGGWLTTVVARVSLNMLRSRRLRHEEPVGASWPGAAETAAGAGTPVSPGGTGAVLAGDPEDEALLADSVGRALLVVLDTLTPAERLAFVLHDMFALPFAEVAAILGRSPDATRQLASRARRRVRVTPSPDGAADLARQREVAAAFLTASRGGNLSALVALLDSDVRPDSRCRRRPVREAGAAPRRGHGRPGRARVLRPGRSVPDGPGQRGRGHRHGAGRTAADRAGPDRQHHEPYHRHRGDSRSGPAATAPAGGAAGLDRPDKARSPWLIS
jgi:RNA polymerase sigma factor (sigma-70 family)